MLESRLRSTLELGNDLLGQRFAQLDTPLVEGIDLPDRALGEDAVLVERDQLAQCGRRQVVEQDDVRWTVALEQPMRHEPIGRAFRGDLLGGLAEGQRLGLGEDIGDQEVLMAAQGVQGMGEGDEIARNEPRPLMDQLVEGMLAVGPRLTPEIGPVS